MEFFTSRHGSVKIAYRRYAALETKFRMLFLTGRAEFFQKYEPLFEIFNNKGISVYAMDHRGQGASGRMLADPHKGHVEKFSHYVDDAQYYLENILMKENPHVPVIALSHSMGGAISLLLACRKKNVFDKIIFSSPMWGINLGGLSHKAAYILSKITVALGKGENYLPGRKGYWADRPFENNQLTHSIDNFKRQKEMVEKEPHLAIGGPTHLWLLESLKAIDELQKESLNTGSTHLILQAEKDTVVDNKYQDKLLSGLNNSEKFVVKGAWHEILYENKAYFNPALEKIFSFFETNK
jgi:lysophospholipase